MIVLDLLRSKYAQEFERPVDIKRHNIPDYFNVIKHPMDLGTVKKKIDEGKYRDNYRQCFDDILLVFSNAYQYNGPAHIISSHAKALHRMFLNKVESSRVFSPGDVEKIRSQMLSDTAGTPKAQSLAVHPAQRAGAARSRHAPAGHPEVSRQTLQTIVGQWKPVDVRSLLDPIPGDTEPLTAAERHQLLLDIRDLPRQFVGSVVQFLQKVAPTAARVEGETELVFRLEDCETVVLRHLRKYVDECLEQLCAEFPTLRGVVHPAPALLSPAAVSSSSSAAATATTTTSSSSSSLPSVLSSAPTPLDPAPRPPEAKPP
jgi:translation initiation factor 2 beta subunit (eIF-2beta)/eIF-5